MGHRNSDSITNMERIFGDLDQMPGSQHDLLYLLEKHANDVRKPRLYVACGTDDFLYHQHVKFVPAAKKLGWDVTSYEEAGIGHEWSFWDAQIKRAIPWMLCDKE